MPCFYNVGKCKHGVIRRFNELDTQLKWNQINTIDDEIAECYQERERK